MSYQAVASDGSWYAAPTENLTTAKLDAERFHRAFKKHANVVSYQTVWSTQTLEEAMRAAGHLTGPSLNIGDQT